MRRRGSVVLLVMLLVGGLAVDRAGAQRRDDRGETPSIAVERRVGPCLWKWTRPVAISELLKLQVRDLPTPAVRRDRRGKVVHESDAWARTMLLWIGGFAHAMDDGKGLATGHAEVMSRHQEVGIVRVPGGGRDEILCHGHVRVTLSPSAVLGAQVAQGFGVATAAGYLEALALETGARVKAAAEVKALSVGIRTGDEAGGFTLGVPPVGVSGGDSLTKYVTLGHTPRRRLLAGFSRRSAETDAETVLMSTRAAVSAEAARLHANGTRGVAEAWITESRPGVLIEGFCDGPCPGHIRLRIRVRP